MCLFLTNKIFNDNLILLSNYKLNIFIKFCENHRILSLPSSVQNLIYLTFELGAREENRKML